MFLTSSSLSHWNKGKEPQSQAKMWGGLHSLIILELAPKSWGQLAKSSSAGSVGRFGHGEELMLQLKSERPSAGRILFLLKEVNLPLKAFN